MYYLVELYSPTTAWLGLGKDERIAFFNKIQAGMAGLIEAKIEIVTMSKIDPNKLHSAKQLFFAIWQCPTEQALDALIEGIQASGWHKYFKTINAAGQEVDITAHLNELALLSKN